MAYEKGSRPEVDSKEEVQLVEEKKFACSVVKKTTKSITRTLQN